MAAIQPSPTCPACGKDVEPSATACPACGHELTGEPSGEREHIVKEDRPRRRRYEAEDDYPPERRRRDITQDPTEEALGWIVPMHESLWAIAAGYLGLFACFPVIGLLPALLAIPCGIMALRDIKRNRGRRGAFRAWFGIALGGLMIIPWTVMLIMMLLGNLK